MTAPPRFVFLLSGLACPASFFVALSFRATQRLRKGGLASSSGGHEGQTEGSDDANYCDRYAGALAGRHDLVAA
jgi:hypothetical protein